MRQIKGQRNIQLSWGELCEILKRQNNGKGLMGTEEIKEITLVKPRQILIRAEQK